MPNTETRLKNVANLPFDPILSKECVELAEFCKNRWYLNESEVAEIKQSYCLDDALDLASSFLVENHHVTEGEFFQALFTAGIIIT